MDSAPLDRIRKAKNFEILEKIDVSLDRLRASAISKTRRHVSRSALHLDIGPSVDSSSAQLPAENHGDVGRICLVFTTLHIRVQYLCDKLKSDFLPAISLYGEGINGLDQVWQDTDRIELISNFLPLLQELNIHVEQIYEVLESLFSQLIALFTSRFLNVEIPRKLHLQSFVTDIERLFSLVICTQETLRGNDCLQEHWLFYQEFIATQLLRLESSPRLAALERMLQKTSFLLFEDSLFQVFCGYITSKTELLSLCLGCVPFQDHLLEHCKRIMEGKFLQYLDSSERKLGCIGIVCFLYKCLNYTGEPSFLNLFGSFLTKNPVLNIYALTALNTAEFVASHIPYLFDVEQLRQLKLKRQSFLTDFDRDIGKTTTEWRDKVDVWIARLNTAVSSQTTSKAYFSTRCAILLQGHEYVGAISKFVHFGISEHLVFEVPISRIRIVPLIDLILCLKEIQTEILSKEATLIQELHPIIRNICQSILSITTKIESKYVTETSKKPTSKTNKKLELLSLLVHFRENICALQINLGCLGSCLVLLNFLKGAGVLDEEKFETISTHLTQIQLVANIKKALSFGTGHEQLLFWNKELLTIYLRSSLEAPEKLGRLVVLTEALNDIPNFLNKSRHLSSPKLLVDAVEVDLLEKFDSLFASIYELIEHDLRIRTHQHLTQENPNPFQTTSKIPSSQLLNLPPFALIGNVMDLREYVRLNLQKNFYNLSTITPDDSSTYASLKLLFDELYSESTHHHSPLPNSGSTEFSKVISIEWILQNLGEFAGRFVYVLHEERFVEMESGSKHLFTFGLSEINQAIRRYGNGIVSHAVNVAYQCLKAKLNDFSIFLYDEYVKAVLNKEARYIRENLKTADFRYPYSKAKELASSVLKYETLKEEGAAISLDKLRTIIKEIGNLVAFVRSFRSGALNKSSLVMLYKHDKVKVAPSESIGDLGESIKSYNDIIESENTEKEIAYMPMLINLVSKLDLQEKYAHFNNFYAIVPALTLNSVRHVLSCREDLLKDRKRASNAGVIMDDGFIVGLAFLLKSLGQEEKFNALKWFDFILDDAASLASFEEDQREPKPTPPSSPLSLFKRLSSKHVPVVAPKKSADDLSQEINATIERRELLFCYNQLNASRLLFL